MTMTSAELQQVRSTPLFAGLSDSQLGCLAEGEVIDVPAGTVLVTEGERHGFFYVLLEGEIRITRTYDRQTVLMRVNKPGEYMGEITLLLDIPWQATARVTKPGRVFRLNEEAFWNMLANCRTVAREVFRAAAVRVRNVEGYEQQREKLVSLGTMAAGLAHEMNNPAAAARRAAAHLQETSEKAQFLQCQLTRCLDSKQWQLLVDAAVAAYDISKRPPVLDHLARSDRTDAVADWLNRNGVPSAWDVAPTFVNAGLDADWLNKTGETLPPACKADALSWLGCRLSLKSLTAEVEQSTTRIAELVKAMKSYSYMDQSPMQEVDIHEGIESTLTMLGYKLKKMEVVRSFDRSLPRVMAYGSELNQVWTNLIDNAADAVKGSGKICIGTCREDNQVVVEIVDNGPGIPPDVQSRMFEPFFTTKAVGSGTGLGLLISNRIVGDRHGGEIEFESRPGRTCFTVRLPINRAPQENLVQKPSTSTTAAAKA